LTPGCSGKPTNSEWRASPATSSPPPH